MPEISVVEDLRFSDDSTAHLRITLHNFTPAGASVLIAQVVHVRYDLHDAVADLARSIRSQTFPQQVARWFTGGVVPASDEEKARVLNEVKKGFEGIINLLDDKEGTSYYDNPDLGPDNYGQTPGLNDETTSVGPKFWTGEPKAPLDVERYGTLIHELSHAAFPFVVTDAGGYFINPGALRNEPLVWYEDAANKHRSAEQPDTDTLLNNADAYAGYLTQYYYRWGPI